MQTLKFTTKCDLWGWTSLTWFWVVSSSKSDVFVIAGGDERWCIGGPEGWITPPGAVLLDPYQASQPGVALAGRRGPLR